METHVILGNIRIGDTLWMWPHFRDEGQRIVAICNRYNLPAVLGLADLTNLRLDEIRCITAPDEAAHPGSSITAFHDWRMTYVPPCGDHQEYRMFDWVPSMAPWPNRYPRRPENFITLQLDSNSDWKEWPPLLNVQFPLPVKTIAEDGLRTIGEPVIGHTITELGHLLLRTRLHVGIASSMCVLATMLGVPTIVCSFLERHELGWIDCPPHLRILTKPTTKEIESAIKETLDA